MTTTRWCFWSRLQGEPLSALSRLGHGRAPQAQGACRGTGDPVLALHPGNVRAKPVINRLYKSGPRCSRVSPGIQPRATPTRGTGHHAGQVRPVLHSGARRIPALVKHCRLAVSGGGPGAAIVLEVGNPVNFFAWGRHPHGVGHPGGTLYVDGKGVAPWARRAQGTGPAGGEGLVIVVMVVDERRRGRSGRKSCPRASCSSNNTARARDAKCMCGTSFEKSRGQPELLKERIRSSCDAFSARSWSATRWSCPWSSPFDHAEGRRGLAENPMRVLRSV